MGESLSVLRRSAEDLDVLDVTHRTNRFDLGLGLRAGPDHAQDASFLPREIARGNAARRAGPDTAEPVRLHDGKKSAGPGDGEEDCKVRVTAARSVRCETDGTPRGYR